MTMKRVKSPLIRRPKPLFFRSYVGVEGEYPYTVEGMIDNVAIRVETPEVK